MSHRMGLRHISRIGKPGCPSGEQITNGGFEVGTLDDWIDIVSGTVKDGTNPYSGLYCAKFPAGSGAEIYQTFGSIPQECILTFNFWCITGFIGPAYGFGAYILYEGWTVGDPHNAAYTTVKNIYNTPNWNDTNLKVSLESAKGKVIGVIFRSIGAADYWVDAASLVCESP